MVCTDILDFINSIPYSIDVLVCAIKHVRIISNDILLGFIYHIHIFEICTRASTVVVLATAN